MKESPSLSEKLLEQMSAEAPRLTLQMSAPILSSLPPFLLKNSPEGQVLKLPFFFEEFANPSELLKSYPSAKILRGHPMEIGRFLNGSDDVYLDFETLGTVLLSRKTTLEVSSPTKMSLWLNYALSPELWGPEGKWTRFHERLHKLFHDQNLLEGSDYPGYYPLKTQARPWASLPIDGDLSDKVFALVLPWTFSLSDLRKLESLMNEEI